MNLYKVTFKTTHDTVVYVIANSFDMAERKADKKLSQLVTRLSIRSATSIEKLATSQGGQHLPVLATD